jgi:hypothetical protein
MRFRDFYLKEGNFQGPKYDIHDPNYDDFQGSKHHDISNLTPEDMFNSLDPETKAIVKKKDDELEQRDKEEEQRYKDRNLRPPASR